MRRFLLVSALLSLGCAPAAPEDVGSSSEAYTTQCPGPTVEGIDISAPQAPVNWGSVVAAGRHFAFIKATQGDYYKSASFASQYAGAKSAGVYRSAYHFFDPTVDGVAQANYFLGTVGTIGPDDLPPMLDVECPDGDNSCLGWSGGTGVAPSATIISRALDWLSTVASKTGKKPIVYSFPAYFPDLGTSDNGLAAYPLFIATLSSCASVPAPWTKAAFWQYSWSGTVNGVPGQVDLDRFFGTMSDLQTFAMSCKSAGATCSGTSECCSGDLCNGAGVCATCLNPGDACKSDAQCCGLSVCTAAGTCSNDPLPSQTTGNKWITAVSWPSTGQAEVFVRGKDGSLHTSIENAGTWTPTASLDRQVACGSAASFWLKNKTTREGFAEVFSPGPNGEDGLDEVYDDTKQTWAAPVDFAGAGLGPNVSLAWPDGHVEVFAADGKGAVWHKYWDFTTNAWVAWASLGGSFTETPTAIIRGDNQAELFAIDASGQPWHNESGPYAGGWSGWRLLFSEGGDAGAPSAPALASRPVPVRWPDGHMELFATTLAGDLVTSTRTTSWSSFTTVVSGVKGEPSVVLSSGKPEIFIRSAQGAVSHTWPIASGWQPLTPLLSENASVDPWAWQWMDGTVEVFAALDDGQGASTLSHVRRDPTGTWGTWQTLGGPVDVCDGSPQLGTDAGADGGATTPPADNGCACTTAPRARSEGAWLAVFGLVLAARRRRYAQGGWIPERS